VFGVLGALCVIRGPWLHALQHRGPGGRRIVSHPSEYGFNSAHALLCARQFHLGRP